MSEAQVSCRLVKWVAYNALLNIACVIFGRPWLWLKRKLPRDNSRDGIIKGQTRAGIKFLFSISHTSSETLGRGHSAMNGHCALGVAYLDMVVPVVYVHDVNTESCKLFLFRFVKVYLVVLTPRHDAEPEPTLLRQEKRNTLLRTSTAHLPNPLSKASRDLSKGYIRCSMIRVPLSNWTSDITTT